jgi:hypothetical protein
LDAYWEDRPAAAHAARTYYSCSGACAETFDAQPERFLQTALSTRPVRVAGAAATHCYGLPEGSATCATTRLSRDRVCDFAPHMA